VACVTLAASPGAAAISNLSVSQIQVDPHGRHEVWISALDPEGAPVGGLTASSLSIREDGRDVVGLAIDGFTRRYARTEWRILVDPALLPPGSDALSDLLAQLGTSIGDRDVIHLSTLAARPRSAEAPVSRSQSLASVLGARAGDGRDASLYDGLFAGVRSAVRVPSERGSLVLVVTRGENTAGRRNAVDVLALSRARSRIVPVSVVLVDPEMNSTESERLGGLATRSGGAFVRVQGLGALAATARQLAVRMRGAYITRYRVPGWDTNSGHHSLSLAVEEGGERHEAEREFEAADVSIAPWWKSPLPWMWLALLAVGVPAATLALRPRQVCRLVVDGGDERGCSFELYALPVSLGAAASNDLVFPDGLVSRNHAVLERGQRSVEVIDLNSENGTFVNGESVGRRRLEDGDHISLGGGVDLIFRAPGSRKA
jgi:hypothetical protein